MLRRALGRSFHTRPHGEGFQQRTPSQLSKTNDPLHTLFNEPLPEDKRDLRKLIKTVSPLKKTPTEWRLHRAAVKKAFPEGWAPPKKLSRDAMDGLRALHEADPETFTTPLLAEKFKISPEAVRRILKSRFTPSEQRLAKVRQKERDGKEQKLQDELQKEIETFIQKKVEGMVASGSGTKVLRAEEIYGRRRNQDYSEVDSKPIYTSLKNPRRVVDGFGVAPISDHPKPNDQNSRAQMSTLQHRYSRDASSGTVATRSSPIRRDGQHPSNNSSPNTEHNTGLRWDGPLRDIDEEHYNQYPSPRPKMFQSRRENTLTGADERDRLYFQ